MRKRCCHLPRRAVVTALVLLVALAPAAGAVDDDASLPSSDDIAVRDGLIAEQESLLNVYRCMFGVDTGVVPGGCIDGRPALGSTEPGVFVGTPTWPDIAVRDGLIASQESLLNVYRCQFDVDTQIVPRGCFGGRPLDLRGELAALTVNAMNELRGGNHPVLELDEALTAIAQAHAQAMADASDWLLGYDFWARLEPDWDFWSIGTPARSREHPDDPRMATEMSAYLLREEGANIRPCPLCTHLATGIATADGATYATVIMAGKDAGRQLTEEEMAAAEAEMTGLVNDLRTSLGLDPLTYDPGVAAAARRWSQIMGARQDFNHNPHAGADYPPGYQFQGENIAAVRLYGTLTLSDVIALSFGDFYGSPYHYAAMVNPDATHIGIGAVLKAGWVWITLNFASHP